MVSRWSIERNCKDSHSDTTSLFLMDSLFVLTYDLLTYQPLGQSRGSFTLFMSSTEIVNLKEFSFALSFC